MISEIETLIPHRAPFLFVDRIVARGKGWLESAWQVPADASWFRGHFPGMPVTPGVILSEHVFQSAGLLVALEAGAARASPGPGVVPVLTKIEEARFRRMVKPGEELTTRVELVERLGPAWVLKGSVACAEESVLKIRFVLASTTAPTLTDRGRP